MTQPLLLDTPDEVARWLPQHRITVGKLKQWARRGHITRYPGERYNAVQVAEYLDGRPDADKRRAATLVAQRHSV